MEAEKRQGRNRGNWENRQGFGEQKTGVEGEQQQRGGNGLDVLCR